MLPTINAIKKAITKPNTATKVLTLRDSPASQTAGIKVIAAVPFAFEDSSHCYLHSSDFQAVGNCNVHLHSHPQGLADVIFDNCVVQVRLGLDLERLIALSKTGSVLLCNVCSNGWFATTRTVLPRFILQRWISTMCNCVL
jgi:hypothetical protein